jgi:hypothetical protein
LNLVLALAALTLALAAPVHCDSGATVFVDGPLRVFGKGYRFHDADETETGHKQYACLRGRGPVAVGQDSVTNGTYGAAVEKYVFAGGRYLAAASYDEGEGGATQYLDVRDLRTGRHRSVNAMLDGAEVPIIRLSANGDLAVDADGALTAYPFAGGKQVLADTGATGLAIAGTTVYWTQSDGPHSAVLAGNPSQEPDEVLEPVKFSRRNYCDSRAGRTVLRTPRIRVVRKGKATVACRVGSGRSVLFTEPTPDLHAAGDRWLSAGDGEQAKVYDLRSLQLVTIAPPAVSRALLPDGTLVWSTAAGELDVRAPGAAEATTLEAAGASAIATTGTTVYWMAGGVAHSWTARA